MSKIYCFKERIYEYSDISSIVNCNLILTFEVGKWYTIRYGFDYHFVDYENDTSLITIHMDISDVGEYFYTDQEYRNLKLNQLLDE